MYSFTWDPGLWMLTYSLLVLGDNTSLCILGERRKFKKYDRGKIGQSYNVCIKKRKLKLEIHSDWECALYFLIVVFLFIPIWIFTIPAQTFTIFTMRLKVCFLVMLWFDNLSVSFIFLRGYDKIISSCLN